MEDDDGCGEGGAVVEGDSLIVELEREGEWDRYLG